MSKVDQNKRLAFKLLILVFVALLFGFALVPLYDVLCRWTGLNGKAQAEAVFLPSAKLDSSRWVTVQFTSNVMPGLGWNFYPKMASMKLHPGQVETVIFIAKNTTDQASSGQAIPSVTPGLAVASLKKIECFCFVQQTLQAGQERAMPLRFFISADLPLEISQITLSYVFFPINKTK